MEVIGITLLRYDAKKKVLTGVSLAEYKQVEVIVDCPGLVQRRFKTCFFKIQFCRFFTFSNYVVAQNLDCKIKFRK
jgi:hypothetical protein